LIAVSVATLVLCATIAAVVTQDTQNESSIHNLMLAARQASLGFVGREQSLYGMKTVMKNYSDVHSFVLSNLLYFQDVLFSFRQ
jgi:hypothetical protein